MTAKKRQTGQSPKQIITDELKDDVCPNCLGDGKISGMGSDNMDVWEDECGMCAGTGKVAKMAQESMPSVAEPAEPLDPVALYAAAPEPWGWWTAWAGGDALIAELVDAGIAQPSIKLLPPIDGMASAEMAALLQHFGGCLSHLYGRIGLIEGRSKALGEVYKNAMMALKGRAESAMVAEKMTRSAITEAAKEQRAINDPDIGESLRETKRQYIELETSQTILSRWIDAYEIAWRTISRQMTGAQAEMELENSRRTL